MRRHLGLLIGCALFFRSALLVGQDLGIRAPDGFRVALYADDALAHDIFSMTIDSQGRVVVAGKGYVKTLHDDDRDGKADRATLYSNVPQSGAHGMVFDGDDLICTGDNSVLRLQDRDGDGQADGEPRRWASLRHPEHGANGIVRGPDGWFYVICGNDAGVSTEHAGTRYSPVTRPECGAVVRFSPDGQQSEIVAHGFRNPYDLDFSASGHLFTVDSDGERDQYLPWYSPTRLFDVAWGQHHGWVLRGWQHSWNRPANFFDSAPRLAEIGRGSPTGVVVYRHRQFPPEYRGSVLSCCWTLGRVYQFPLERDGSSFRTRTNVFLETTGEVGFAPVDMAVGPEGELFVAIGGRQTRGSVFRITYRGEAAGAREVAEPATELDRVLLADQPLAAWSRARWLPPARRLGPEPFAAAALDARRDDAVRQRALEILADAWDGVTAELTEPILQERRPAVAARALSLLSRRTPAERATGLLADATAPVVDVRIRRAAWESLGQFTADRVPEARFVRRAESEGPDRPTRSAALWAVRAVDRDRLQPPDLLVEQLARRRGQLSSEEPPRPTSEQLAMLVETIGGNERPAVRLEAVRLAQLELGDVRTEPTDPPVYAGYAARRPDAIGSAERSAWATQLARRFPVGQRDIDYELARLLGMLQEPSDDLLDRFAGVWSATTRVEDDLHYLIVLSRLPGERSEATRRATAAALVRLHEKMRAGPYYASRNWPARVGEMFQELCRRDPQLAQRVVAMAEFGLAEHSLFALAMEGETRRSAARKLALHADRADDDGAWTSELVEAIGTLPADEALPRLRAQWNNYVVRDAIALALGRFGHADDRARLVEALASVQATTVERAADALRRMGGSGEADEIVAAVQALRQASLAKEQAPIRRALHELLTVWTDASIEVDQNESKPAAVLERWQQWLMRQRPELVARVQGSAGVDTDAWRRRLEGIDWGRGDVERGKVSFEKRACARCHRATDRLGPDLAGVTGRLAARDLFVAIVDPNQEVAPLYQTTQVVTRSGKIFQGLIVYESPESTLVQTTPDETLRVTGQEIVVMRKTRQSLMPVGLLNNADDLELADLYAYIKTLRAGR